MILNDAMALLRYFTEFTYNVVLKQLLGLPPFQNLRFIVQGRSYIWGNRGGRLGCFQDCCLSENSCFDQSNFTIDCHDYIAV